MRFVMDSIYTHTASVTLPLAALGVVVTPSFQRWSLDLEKITLHANTIVGKICAQSCED